MVPHQLNPFVTLSAKLGFIRKELLELLSEIFHLCPCLTHTASKAYSGSHNHMQSATHISRVCHARVGFLLNGLFPLQLMLWLLRFKMRGMMSCL